MKTWEQFWIFFSLTLFKASFPKDGTPFSANLQNGLGSTGLWHYVALNPYWGLYSIFNNLSVLIILGQSSVFMPVLLIFLPLFDILFNNNKKSKSHSGSEFQQVANGSELNFSSIFDLIVFIFVIFIHSTNAGFPFPGH